MENRLATMLSYTVKLLRDSLDRKLDRRLVKQTIKAADDLLSSFNAKTPESERNEGETGRSKPIETRSPD